MSKERPYVMSIAGYDPSGGAGLLADIKTFEQHKVVGLGVQTALTWQNAETVSKIEWRTLDDIIQQIELLKQYPVKTAKIGIVQNSTMALGITEYLTKTFSTIKIVWDPIVKATANYTFFEDYSTAVFEQVLEQVYLVTPNISELENIANGSIMDYALTVSSKGNIYLKGGHSEENPGKDYLFSNGVQHSYNAKNTTVYPKHGSGCVLSSAIVANLAKDYPLRKTILRSKRYIEQFLGSNKTLLGWHN